MNKLYITIIAIVVLAGLGFFIFKSPALAPTMPGGGVACTQEAKLCSDGSYVSRTGPNCEFAQCPNAPISKSGIRGEVTLGPSCPGPERVPPDLKCAPKPYSTSISITKAGSVVSSTIHSDSNGSFSIELGPGTYTLQAQGGKVYPRCPQVSVSVKSGTYTTTGISCDTGIR